MTVFSLLNLTTVMSLSRQWVFNLMFLIHCWLTNVTLSASELVKADACVSQLLCIKIAGRIKKWAQYCQSIWGFWGPAAQYSCKSCFKIFFESEVHEFRAWMYLISSLLRFSNYQSLWITETLTLSRQWVNEQKQLQGQYLTFATAEFTEKPE